MKGISMSEANVKRVKELSGLFAALAIVYLCFDLIGIGCPIKWLTGVSCAGCGMTRAWISVIHGDLRQAFFYHPLFPIPPVVAATILVKNRLNKTIYNGILLTSILLFIIIYVSRLIWFKNEIVVFEPQKGMIVRIIKVLIN